MKRFSTLQLSIDGELFSKVGPASRFKDIVAEGSTQSQSVRFSGFADPGKFGVYEPDYVTIESPEGNVLHGWRNPNQMFRGLAQETPRDELYLVFSCGFSVWNYMTTPFLLTHPDVKVEELPTWQERDQPWRRLRAVFPPNIVTHSREQTFYFDEAGLQRRTDHDLLGTHVRALFVGASGLLRHCRSDAPTVADTSARRNRDGKAVAARRGDLRRHVRIGSRPFSLIIARNV